MERQHAASGKGLLGSIGHDQPWQTAFAQPSPCSNGVARFNAVGCDLPQECCRNCAVEGQDWLLSARACAMGGALVRSRAQEHSVIKSRPVVGFKSEPVSLNLSSPTPI